MVGQNKIIQWQSKDLGSTGQEWLKSMGQASVLQQADGYYSEVKKRKWTVSIKLRLAKNEKCPTRNAWR